MGRLLQLAIHMLVVGFGLLLTVSAGLDSYQRYQISAHGSSTNARVLEKHEDHSQKYTRYLITFTFIPEHSTTPIAKTASVYFDTYQALQPESSLSIRYLPAQPTEALVDGQARFPLWIGLLGMTITVVGVIDLRKALRDRGHDRTANKYGRISQATINRLERRQRR